MKSYKIIFHDISGVVPFVWFRKELIKWLVIVLIIKRVLKNSDFS